MKYDVYQKNRLLLKTDLALNFTKDQKNFATFPLKTINNS